MSVLDTGKVIPFPKQRRTDALDSKDSVDFSDLITNGKATYLGRVSRDGMEYDFYRYDLDGQLTYIFNVIE